MDASAGADASASPAARPSPEPASPAPPAPAPAPADAPSPPARVPDAADGGGVSEEDEMITPRSSAAAPPPAPVERVAPTSPDVFDRLGYGPSDDEREDAREDDGPSDRANDGSSDGASTSSSASSDAPVAAYADAVDAVLAGDADLDAPRLGTLARNLQAALMDALAEDETPSGDDAPRALADAPAIVAAVVARLPSLARALTLAPPPAVLRVKSAATGDEVTAEEPAAGTHRVATVEIFAALLGAGIPEVDEAVATTRVERGRGPDPPGGAGAAEEEEEGASGGSEASEHRRAPRWCSVASAAAAMLFAHERSTAAHCAAARLTCAALACGDARATAPLLEPGWASAAVAAGVVSKPIHREEAEEVGSNPGGIGGDGSVQAKLAALGERFLGKKPGRRPCHLGVALVVAGTLRDLEEEERAPTNFSSQKTEDPARIPQPQPEETAEETAAEETATDPEREVPVPPTGFEPASSSASGASSSGSADPGSRSSPGGSRSSRSGSARALVRDALARDETWRAFCAPGGALEAYDEEQSGTLCGPKPNRVAPGDFGAGAGGMSGKDLLLMLQSLGRSAGAVPAHEQGGE